MSLLIIFFCFEIKISEVLFIGLGAYAAENMLSNLRTCIYTVLRLMEFPDSRIADVCNIHDNSYPVLYVILFIARKGIPFAERFLFQLYIQNDTYNFLCDRAFHYVSFELVESSKRVVNISVNIYAVICDLLLIVAQFGLFYGGKVSVDKVIAEHMLAAIARTKEECPKKI